MASASVVIPPSEIELTIKLNPEEAERLKTMMQNEWFQNEGAVLRNIRETIWAALHDAGVTTV